MDLKTIKNYYELNKKEIIELSLAIARGNSKMNEGNILGQYSKFPFIDKDFNLTDDVKEDIKNKYSTGIREGQSLMLSLISIQDSRKNTRNHIISMEILQNKGIQFYINETYLIEELNFKKAIIEKIKKKPDFEEVVLDLINISILKLDDNKRIKFNKTYANMSLSLKIEELKEIFKLIFKQHFELDGSSFLFFIDDVNVKNSLITYYLNTKNEYMNFNLLKFYNEKIKKQKYKMFKSLYSFEDDNLISQSQKNALKNPNNNINVMMGPGGSGKTFLASHITKKFLLLNAISKFQNVDEEIPSINLMYTTYSKYSLKQYIKYISSFKNVIYRDDIEIINNRIQHFSDNIDLEKYNKIKNKIKKIDLNISEQIKQTNKLNKINENVNKMFNYSLSIGTIEQLNNYMKYLESKKKTYSFIDNILYSLGIKKYKRINIPKSYTNYLLSKGIKVKNVIEENLIDKFLDFLKRKYLIKQAKVDKKFSKTSNELYLSNTLLKFPDFDEEELNYFLTYRPIVEKIEKKDIYLKLLENLRTNIENNKNIKIDYNLFNELFPVVGDKITNILKHNCQFTQVIVDESSLVPGYFFPTIMSKTINIIALADFNQLNMHQNIHPNLYSILDRIYTKPNQYKISSIDGNSLISFFDHIELLSGDNKNNHNILVDNFRNNKKIHELSLDISNSQYDQYFKNYIAKYNLNINTDDLSQDYSQSDIIFNYKNNVIDTPFLFINNDENKYKKLEEFINSNNINYSDVMIIVPFKYNIKKIKEKIGNKFAVENLENVQGIERKIIVFDWDCSSVEDEEFLFMTRQRFNMLVTRAMYAFITIGNENFLFDNYIDEVEEEGYFIINRFLRNDKYEIYHLD